MEFLRLKRGRLGTLTRGACSTWRETFFRTDGTRRYTYDEVLQYYLLPLVNDLKAEVIPVLLQYMPLVAGLVAVTIPLRFRILTSYHHLNYMTL
jgi:hypothetical protein